MANIAIFKRGEAPKYLLSVNTPDYEGDPDVLVNPNIESIKDVPLKYWKRQGNEIVEMSQSEKNELANEDLQERKKQAEIFNLELKDIIEVLIIIGNTQWAQGRTVTKQQIIQALKDRIQ